MFSKFYVVKQRIKNVKGHYFLIHDDFGTVLLSQPQQVSWKVEVLNKI